VSLRLMVDATGCPASAGTKDLPEKAALVDAAWRTLKQWRFQPATKDGKPVRVMITVNVTFRPSGGTEYSIANNDIP
jgi:outer membrane biosynthesis protein TonB